MRLQNKVALISGSSVGIGEAIAKRFAAEGAEIAVNYKSNDKAANNVVDEIISSGGKAKAFKADVSKVKEIERLQGTVIEEFGGIDILVNNAGHSSKIRSIRYVDSKEWESVFKVNVEGVYRLTQSLLESMIENKEGTIITVSSVAAIKPGLMGGAPYSSAKAASANLMGHINSELNNLGIRACTIFPAEVDTPILSKRPLPPDIKARSNMMQPIDIANAILLCAAMPQRTLVQEMILKPTFDRDMTEELIKAGNLRN